MLLITNDGRKAALDQRLVDIGLGDYDGSKVNTCVQNIYEIWEKNADKKAAQLVFCDLSTPKDDGSFNVYDDIRNKLIERGIPPEEIAFIHAADTDTKKKELFAKVRRGQVRVLMSALKEQVYKGDYKEKFYKNNHIGRVNCTKYIPWFKCFLFFLLTVAALLRIFCKSGNLSAKSVYF